MSDHQTATLRHTSIVRVLIVDDSAYVRKMMTQMLANAPLAIALCIEAVDRGLDMSVDEGCALEANHFGLLAATDDMREGMRAFLEKRPAQFSGR